MIGTAERTSPLYKPAARLQNADANLVPHPNVACVAAGDRLAKLSYVRCATKVFGYSPGETRRDLAADSRRRTGSKVVNGPDLCGL